jgi:hypothetical protein
MSLAKKVVVLMGGGGVSASPLLTGLVSHWKMDETTGNRVDSHGDFDMVPAGTVGYDTGVLGNCATFVTGEANYLLVPNNAALLAISFPSLTVAGWFYIPTAYADVSAILDKRADFYLHVDASGLYLSVADSGPGLVAVDYNVTINADTWYFVAARVDMAGDRKARVKLNDGDWQVSGIALTAGQVIQNGVNYMSTNRTGSATAKHGTCWYDSISLWTRALQDSEIDLLYNEGAGLDYPFS